MTVRWPERFWLAVGVGCTALLVFAGLRWRHEPAAHFETPAGDRPERETTVWQISRGPIVVWLVLLIILAGSAWSAFFPLGSLNPTINLLLATLMLLVLAIFLMDLGQASPVVRLVAAAGLLWVVFLFALTFTDYLSRRQTLPARSGGLAPGLAPPAAENVNQDQAGISTYR